MLPLKRHCSLSQSKTAIPSPKFGVYTCQRVDIYIEQTRQQAQNAEKEELEGQVGVYMLVDAECKSFLELNAAVKGKRTCDAYLSG